ncbi:hypothetical protein HPP92_019534 [Vanilla planifolia]|uniref:Uncharacterized protein n=1 Tax=Vanilla planifolia TaxID=51239 RepID=A0A835ULT4_VANPL|nr:hypothetical protein HPP92_019534 [Vanilla planifolia]
MAKMNFLNTFSSTWISSQPQSERIKTLPTTQRKPETKPIRLADCFRITSYMAEAVLSFHSSHPEQKMMESTNDIASLGGQWEGRLRQYILHESGLSEKFSPVPLLKSHLQNFRKCANSILRKMNH